MEPSSEKQPPRTRRIQKTNLFLSCIKDIKKEKEIDALSHDLRDNKLTTESTLASPVEGSFDVEKCDKEQVTRYKDNNSKRDNFVGERFDSHSKSDNLVPRKGNERNQGKTYHRLSKNYSYNSQEQSSFYRKELHKDYSNKKVDLETKYHESRDLLYKNGNELKERSNYHKSSNRCNYESRNYSEHREKDFSIDHHNEKMIYEKKPFISHMRSYNQPSRNRNEFKQENYHRSVKRYNSYEPQKYFDFNGKESFSKSVSPSYVKHDVGNVEENHFNFDDKSSAENKTDEQNFEDYIEFHGEKNSRTFLNLNDRNFKISLKNDISRSESDENSNFPLLNSESNPEASRNQNSWDDSCESLKKNDSDISGKHSKFNNLPEDVRDFTALKLSSSSDLVSPTVSDLPCEPSHLNLQSTFLLPSENNFIPPPVGCLSIENTLYETNSQDVSSENIPLQNENFEFSQNSEEDYLLEDQIEAITQFISTVVKEKSVSTAIVPPLLQNLNDLFRDQFDGHTIDVYGSYASNLAISTSDINLVVKSDISLRKSFMHEIYKVLLNAGKNYYVHPYEDGQSAHQIKINFAHPETGVNCQLVYLGKYANNICKMGLFLRRIIQYDERIRMLIIAAKIWSESLCINEPDDGKLHSLGYALMVVHFLQRCDNPILTNFPCEHGDVEMLPPNKSSIGQLWLAFLKYYAVTFDWKQEVITIKSGEPLSKISKGWGNYWIAVEDPFTEKNIAESVVNSDVADYIKTCFRSSYEYFCTPPENLIFGSSNEEESTEDSESPKLQFSFQQCVAEQSDSFCEKCDEIMDICDECQKKLYVPPMSTLPKMTDSFLKLVKESLITIYEKYILSDSEIKERQEFVKEMEKTIRKKYPDADLNLFGSSANGFGFKKSDLDICITFRSKKIINSASVLKDVRFLLRKNKDFDHVVAIFNAQIPIVKFHYQPKEWRGDISLDNTLAIHNSDLLYTYSLLDERCRILGCAFKLLAKKAIIAEVTDRALSSYSYLNMVIHFLQQVEPPVLPVLQDNKFRQNDYKIDHIVENCNVWFCKDLDYIKKEFKAENQTSVEQLWLDLLEFYTTYDTNKFISIRQKEPVYANENKRSARLFNIQDPFIETKNLGCVVSAKKAHETKSILCRARQLFKTPIKELPTYVKDIEDFFFSTQSLTGRIHKEVHCDLCGKFGHEKKDCKQSCFPLQKKFFYRRPPTYQNAFRGRKQTPRPFNGGPDRKRPFYNTRYNKTCSS